MGVLFGSLSSIIQNLDTEQVWVIIQGIFGIFILCILVFQSIDFGWHNNHPTFRLKKKEGLTEEEVDKKIKKEFARYISGLDAYNHDIARHDQDARVLITHKLDEIQFPPIVTLTEEGQALLRRTVLYTLLVMNMENHYVDASQSQDKLIFYLSEKYKKISMSVHLFVEDWQECYIYAYGILDQWWTIVGQAIHAKTLHDLETDYTRVDLLQDPTWKKRMDTTITKHKKCVANIEKMSSVRPAVMKYFEDEHYAVPSFLHD